MPSSLEIVVASDSGVEPIGKFPPDLNVSYFHHMPPTSSAHVKEPLGTYAGPRETREAGVFTRYISDRYDSLPDAVVFVHADIDVHNPVWLRWLYCLRRNVEFASLSPAIIYMPSRGPQLLNFMSKGSAVITDSQMQARLGDYGFPNCCFLVVVSHLISGGLCPEAADAIQQHLVRAFVSEAPLDKRELDPVSQRRHLENIVQEFANDPHLDSCREELDKAIDRRRRFTQPLAITTPRVMMIPIV